MIFFSESFIIVLTKNFLNEIIILILLSSLLCIKNTLIMSKNRKIDENLIMVYSIASESISSYS